MYCIVFFYKVAGACFKIKFPHILILVQMNRLQRSVTKTSFSLVTLHYLHISNFWLKANCLDSFIGAKCISFHKKNRCANQLLRVIYQHACRHMPMILREKSHRRFEIFHKRKLREKLRNIESWYYCYLVDRRARQPAPSQ